MNYPKRKYTKKIDRLDKANLYKDRIIENINQETGVTIQQLLDYCKFLAKTMDEGRFLTAQQRTDAIYFTAEAIHRHMQSGHVPNKNFEDFRSYLYRTMHNHLLKTHLKPIRQKSDVG